MKKYISDKEINLIITSPPYNLENVSKYKKIKYNSYKDDKDFFKYISWLKDIFFVCYEKLSDDGRVVINIGDQKNGSVPTHFYITQAMLELGYNYYTTIIWKKNQISRRTSWGSFLSPSCPSFPTPFEYILVFYKNSKKLLHKGETDLTKEEFIKWSLSVWDITPETKMKIFSHPAVFPLELPTRCIKMFSFINDVVLDPFMGTGTTGLACKINNRSFYGFEIDKEYFEMTQKRIFSLF